MSKAETVALVCVGILVLLKLAMLVGAMIRHDSESADRAAEEEMDRIDRIKQEPGYKRGFNDGYEFATWSPLADDIETYSRGYNAGKSQWMDDYDWTQRNGSSNS